MKITLEHVDEIMKRKNVSYAEAKAALEESDGDVLEALTLLEEVSPNKPSRSLWDKIKSAVSKLHQMQVMMIKDDKISAQLPGTIVTLLFMAIFPFMIFVVLLSIIFGYTFKVQNTGKDELINKNLQKVSDSLEDVQD